MQIMSVPIYYKPHKSMNFRYGDAVALAQSLQTKHPEWLVCGSLALMLSGYLPVRQLSDIDFATRDFSSIPRFNRMYSTEYKNQMTSPGLSAKYYHVSSKDGWCLFVHQNVSHAAGFYQHLRLQNIGEVLLWKKLFNREKDRDDLKSHLPEELFEI